MSFQKWLRNLRSALATNRGRHQGRRRASPHASTRRPKLEVLEDRSLLSFSPAVNFPVGTNPRAIATADFNNDGRLDLATADTGGNAVSALLGNGQGGFSAASHFAVSAPRSLAVSDFNSDGKIDLAVANFNGVSLLLGNGDGTLRPPVVTAFWWEATSLAPADFNADGNMDLAYTSVDPTSWDGAFVQVLVGDGQGGFALADLDWSYSNYASEVAVADLNADGKLDAVTPNVDTGTVSVSLGYGMVGYDYWSPTGSLIFNTSPYPQAVAVGDFTGDGIPDLVIAGQNVDLLPGLGDGTFDVPIPYSAAGSAHSDLAIGDFNGDGKLDVITSDADANFISVLLGNANGTLSYAGAFATSTSPAAVATGDFNSDGRPDAANANAGSNTVSVLLNDGVWTPPPPPLPTLRIGDLTVTEGNTGTRAANFTVTLSAASSQPVTVVCATGNSTATAGSDYQAVSGTLTFAPGETTKSITVPVIGDRRGEPNETFVVILSSPTNATISDGQGVGKIMDDEPRVSISDVTKAEGKNNQTTLFVFTVTLSAAYDQAVTVSYQTVNGAAKSGEDYVAQSGTLTFAPGETSKTITIVVKGDNKREANESFYLDLFGLSSNALFTKYRGIGTILNDD